MSRIIKDIVVSSTPPQNTDVMWYDTENHYLRIFIPLPAQDMLGGEDGWVFIGGRLIIDILRVCILQCSDLSTKIDDIDDNITDLKSRVSALETSTVSNTEE